MHTCKQDINISRENLVHIIQDTVKQTTSDMKWQENGISFADMVKKNRPKEKLQEKSVLLIRSKKEQAKSETLSSVKDSLKNIRVTSTEQIKNGGLAVKFPDKEELLRAKQELEKSNGYSLSRPKTFLPKVTITNVKITNEDEFITALQAKNKKIANLIQEGEVCEILFSKDERKRAYARMYVLKVSAKLRHALLEDNGEVYIGMNKCKVFDRFPIFQCYNCQWFGHKAKDCTGKTVCGKCSQEHKTNECGTNTPKCGNCVGNGVDGNKDHYAFDKSCTFIRNEKRKIIENTNYEINEFE